MEKNCDTCGSEFTPARADARYCSGRCRTIAYRRRHEVERPETKPRKRRPLPEVYAETARGLFKQAERLSRLTADDRFARNREVLQSDRAWLVLARDRIDAVIADLSHDEPVVTVARVDDNSARPFKKSDVEMLAEITGTVADLVDLLQLVRPREVATDDAIAMASRARVAWQAIDRRLTEIITPSRHRTMKS